MSPHVDLQMVAGALHEDRHLVRHLADIRFGSGQYRQAGALPGRGHEEEARRHLDDGLADVAAAEVPARAARQRIEPGGECRQVLGVRLAEAAGSTEFKGLPRRVRQASLAPELRASAKAVASAQEAGVPRATAASLADMRNTLSAMQRGWQQGRSQTQPNTEGGADGN